MSEVRNVTILTPSHGLEDFPTELTEEESEGVLNAFAICRHPALLVETKSAPEIGRADEPPHHLEGHLVIVPQCCEGWMPHEWTDHARTNGATVIENCVTREDYERELLPLLTEHPELPKDLVQDFYALGTAWLLIELLTRKMHYYSSMDEHIFNRDQMAAAEAAVNGDETATRAHLQGCFETLLECREHFYPVDCFLLDVCLLHPEVVDEHFLNLLKMETPVNILLKGEHLREIASTRPDVIELLKIAIADNRIEILGGDEIEKPISCTTLQSTLWDLHQGRETYQKQLGQSPTTFARKRFGFTTQLPQILSQSGFHSAFHLALDDGLYPDEEQSKFRWEGCDGTVIDAVSRIPLAADAAASYLRFADRMAESMQDDQVAGILFARWPEVKGVWFQDFLRIQSYAPVLGKFVTMNDFILTTDHSGRLSRHQEKSYLSPYLLQAVAYGEPNPVSRFQRFLKTRHQFDQTAWLYNMMRILTGQNLDNSDSTVADWETRLEISGPDLPIPETNESSEEQTDAPGQTAETFSDVEAKLSDWREQTVQQFAYMITRGGTSKPGKLIVNTLAHSQTAVINLEGFNNAPTPSDAIKAVQVDDHVQAAVVEIPGSGYLWIEESDSPSNFQTGVRSAEEMVLRNEFFEVLINEQTGGIQHLKGYGRTPNRLSQHLAFRFLQEKQYHPSPEQLEEIRRTNYTLSRMTDCQLTSTGPALGEMVTNCELYDPEEGTVIATAITRYRVWRSRPILEMNIEITPLQEPEGDPWSCYYTSRFAWKHESAVLTRGLLQGAHGLQGERFEAPYYLEIADSSRRTTILTDGVSCHRRSGARMVDSILIPAGESQRNFSFWIAFDEDYPLQAAHQMLMPPLVTSLEKPPQREAGWFLRLKEKNIQILNFEPLLPDPLKGSSGNLKGYTVRLLETEGRSRRVKLRLLKAPIAARKRDLPGNTMEELPVQKEYVIISMRGHEMANVDLIYSEHMEDEMAE